MGLVVLACSLLGGPVIVFAATGSVQVGQQSDTGVAPPGPGTTGGGGGSGGSNLPQISNVAVTLSYNSATINWNTSELALSRVSWGTSRDYRNGTIAGEQFTKKHSSLISDLLPNTTYYFQIISIGANNNQSTYASVFQTLTPADTGAPSNVTEFIATPRLNHIQLSWNNPSEPDFNLVRIVRSEIFFPTDPLNGKVLYEGTANNFADFNVTQGVVYYYSAFARDANGNYASGSVAYALIASSDGLNTDPAAPTVDLQFPYVKNPPAVPNAFKDFSFSYRDGLSLDLESSVIPVGQSLEISIPKDRLPNEGALLTLTIEDIDKKSIASTYLFSYDKDNENFKVKTPAFKTPKSYSLMVTVFTSTKLIIEKVSGSIEIVSEAQASEGESNGSGSLPQGIILGTVGVAAVMVTVHFWRLVRIRQRLLRESSSIKKELE